MSALWSRSRRPRSGRSASPTDQHDARRAGRTRAGRRGQGSVARAAPPPRAIVGTLPLVEDDEESWQLRRALYVDRLSSETGFLVFAIDQDAVVGYALVCIEEGPDDTFPGGERYAELYSLSVAPHLRGRKIGTRLLDFVDDELARRSIKDLQVAVMVANEAAQRLYERRGLRPAELVLYRFGARPS